jgi:hypothetical protein
LVAGILVMFAADPDGAFTVADVAMRAYGVGLRQVTKVHRVAVLRAMRRVCAVEPRFGLENGMGGEGQMVVFDGTRVLSRGLGVLKCRSGYYQWRRCGPRSTEEGLRARLASPGDYFHEAVSPGGHLWRRCQRAMEVGVDREAAEAGARRAAVRAAVEKADAAGLLGRRRYNPDPVPPDGPDPAWDDNDAWKALWMKAQGKKQRRDVAERRIKAAGGTAYATVYELPVDLPKGLALDCVRGWAAVTGFDGGPRWVRRATVSSERPCLPEETRRVADQQRRFPSRPAPARVAPSNRL